MLGSPILTSVVPSKFSVIVWFDGASDSTVIVLVDGSPGTNRKMPCFELKPKS